MDSQTRTLIVGLGKTGLSCARHLAAQGVPLAITDSREEPPGLSALREELPDVALFLGAFDDKVFESADLLVVSPGVPVSTPQVAAAMRRGVSVIGDIELFARAANAPVAAITGSNGKSTVTMLLGRMAQAAGIKTAVGGNLGEPALDLLADDVALYVLELSSFQLETTESLQAATATVLNVSPDHMDRYDSLEDYTDAKARLYRGAHIGIYNADDPRVMAMQGDAAEAWFFTLNEPAGEKVFGRREVDGEIWLCQGDECLLRADDLLLPGTHNQANALAALALGTALKLNLEAMLQALREFRGLPHRTEYVAEIDQVSWYNDSKGTNLGACIAALEGLAQPDGSRTVLIAGGDCKQADFSGLAPVVAACARAAILLGHDAPAIEKAVAGKVPVYLAADMDEAVALAAEQARPGDRVLLSPACASFDMYRSYEQRGDLFMEAVLRLVQ